MQTMKPNPIKRGIESRHARTIGNAPKLGKVSRLRDAESPLRGRRSRRSNGVPGNTATGRARRKVVLTWSVALAVGAVLVIGGFMLSWLDSHGSKTDDAGSGAVENVRISSKFASPKEDEALALVKKALVIRDPREVETLFRTGGAQPGEVVEYMKASAGRDGALVQCSWLSSMDVEGLLIEGVLVAYQRDGTKTERLALLVPDEKGVWKIDFDAFARTSKPAWREFLNGAATYAEVRVLIARDVYYNGPFLDESKWVCFGMASPETKAILPEGQEMLRGYCKAGSPQAKAMERIFKAGGKMNRATLEIRKTEGAEPRQFEITRVLSEDWVISQKPFDERFN
jgi:hypothetical protein